jgi:hypothetical protein
MHEDKQSIGAQFKRNFVALVSLTIAISSLAYNTWRNEQTEYNRNQRVAAFEILMKLGDLQNVVFHHYYDQDEQDKGNPRTGWTYVLTIQDLSRLLTPQMQVAAKQLGLSWQANWENLKDSHDSNQAVMAEIENTRDTTLALLESLQ